MKKLRFLSVMLVAALLASVICNTSAFATATPEWAADNVRNTVAKAPTGANLPAKYDLRDEGVVPPVRFQNPWGTCWAFGGTAAAEISILSSLGLTAKETNLDLSERHIAYFSHRPVTKAENASQAGEGLYISGDAKNKEFSGGDLGLFTTIYSQGVGPVSESLFPYRGKNAVYVADSYQYSSDDDWSIPETNENGQSNRLINGGFVLKDGNVLPEYWVADKNDLNNTEISVSAQTAIKQELLNGRGVSFGYWADQSGKYASSDKDKGMLYAQYCGEDVGHDHAVCIVGYDDTYSASNFTHTKDRIGNQITDADGKELSDEDAEVLTTPPGDGAWIVKNSWGSETDATIDDLGNEINYMPYGLKNSEGKATGYFYLSYYDKTITNAETFTFSSNLADSDEFAVLQYDYMPSLSVRATMQPSEEVMSSSNTFNVDQNVLLKSVSTSTNEANMRVTFAIYKLNDNATNPTDGTKLRQFSENFQYGGFHRVDLNNPLKLARGERFSIISTASVVDSDGKRKYNVSANLNLSEEIAKPKAQKEDSGDIEKDTGADAVFDYAKSVINEGESYLYNNGKWYDWKGVVANLTADCAAYQDACIDNFSIKAYVVPSYTDISTCTFDSIAAQTYTGKAITPAVTVKDGSSELTSGNDYTVEYKNNTNAGTAAVTVKGSGLYTGSKSITFKINKAANPVKVTSKKTVTASSGKKTTIKKAVTVKSAQGTVTYKTNNKKVTVKEGTMTVAKGLKEGKTIAVKVTVIAKGTKNYKSKTVSKTIIIKVK
ncbi:MAG: hypothetical protein K6F88_06760 [Ruminococcus sp.]|nr:hypothetical protein [Ruminococcus sp.]